ncbi:hypothetical protein K469DRAFT_744292 [Zopfia rhizophila CBS 207.26]|uniref:Uncharacterized protein n=1 Tax=Zopfia rhizophila CBS 207.26 TaxID=1314779 RepID=A0A6A6F0F2_9PEZI|nr:hypothetical protein K469DRAFT_744292 [Zopfia rhizophila CBS 207.26]
MVYPPHGVPPTWCTPYSVVYPSQHGLPTTWGTHHSVVYPQQRGVPITAWCTPYSVVYPSQHGVPTTAWGTHHSTGHPPQHWAPTAWVTPWTRHWFPLRIPFRAVGKITRHDQPLLALKVVIIVEERPGCTDGIRDKSPASNTDAIVDGWQILVENSTGDEELMSTTRIRANSVLAAGKHVSTTLPDILLGVPPSNEGIGSKPICATHPSGRILRAKRGVIDYGSCDPDNTADQKIDLFDGNASIHSKESISHLNNHWAGTIRGFDGSISVYFPKATGIVRGGGEGKVGSLR